MAFKYIHIHQVNGDFVCRVCCNILIFIQVFITKYEWGRWKLEFFILRKTFLNLFSGCTSASYFTLTKPNVIVWILLLASWKCQCQRKAVNLFLECFIQEIHFCWEPDSTESTCLTSLMLSQVPNTQIVSNKAPSAEWAHSSSPLDISPLTVGLQTVGVHLNWGFKLQQAFSLLSLCLVSTFGVGSKHFHIK